MHVQRRVEEISSERNVRALEVRSMWMKSPGKGVVALVLFGVRGGGRSKKRDTKDIAFGRETVFAFRKDRNAVAVFGQIGILPVLR